MRAVCSSFLFFELLHIQDVFHVMRMMPRDAHVAVRVAHLCATNGAVYTFASLTCRPEDVPCTLAPGHSRCPLQCLPALLHVRRSFPWLTFMTFRLPEFDTVSEMNCVLLVF